MKRLIDAQDAFNVLTDYYHHHTSAQHLALQEALNKVPTLDAEPQWIPCSERLPEVRQWVLCQCRAGIMDVLRLTADGSWNKNYPHTEYMGGFVVAWMPLPNPYEAKEE